MITNKKHRKHAKLVRPALGSYSRFEIGILGATCGRIKTLVDTIADQLKAQNIFYIDADHSEEDQPNLTTLTDGINHHRLVHQDRLTEYDQKAIAAKSDITIVNCNHFVAKQQIACCTLKKKESLSRKLDRLTDLKVILLDEDIEAPFDFLADIIKTSNPLILKMSDIDTLSAHILELYRLSLPMVNALIMAGGKSQRMGQDKSMLDYHGLPQWQHIAGITEGLNLKTFISCRTDQTTEFQGYETIEDSFIGLGPYGAILSAFRSDPNAAWLTIACDLPLLGEEHLSELINQADYSSTATSYHNPETGWPAPMVTMWMPKAYPELLKFLALGYSCPRKVLINTDVHLLHVDDTTFLHNANTPEDRTKALALLA